MSQEESVENPLEESLDAWRISLIQKTQALENCQKEKNLKSCMGCEKILACEIRDNYIQAVYDSMSKGQGGGFEF